MRRINERMAIAGILTAGDLEQLTAQGYRTVIDLRADGEPPPEALPPREERQRAAELGVSYHQVPIVMGLTSNASVGAVRRLLREADGSVVLHCASGRIATALALIYSACDEGATLGECFARAEAMGLDCDGSPGLLAFWVGYILEHPRCVRAGSV
jgi:uncharacterized protein (TIGR01244 family)